MIKMDNFQYFSIKAYDADVYKNRLTEIIKVKHWSFVKTL